MRELAKKKKSFLEPRSQVTDVHGPHSQQPDVPVTRISLRLVLLQNQATLREMELHFLRTQGGRGVR